MPLASGTRLGSYEIIAPLGSGGMGEVYRARDTKLHRDVALKVLPELFSHDADRLARFTREAHVLASLNHPNIAIIHGLEEADPGSGLAGAQALVMELVEGPTVADRIGEGPIPIPEALAIARQIADALEAAHTAGVIHRDLKPANIIIQGAWGPRPSLGYETSELRPGSPKRRRRDGGTPTRWKTSSILAGTPPPRGPRALASSVDSPPRVSDDIVVKVLDFGLAKVLDPVAPTGNLSMSPTLTSPAATRLGVVLGTAAYMAPEQARGKAVDKRADIWAFGCVLYEMLTARRVFEGEDMTDTVAAVVRAEPDWRALPSETPPAIRRLLRRCLQKDPKDRLRDVGDARLEIQDVLASPETDALASGSPAAARRWRERLAWPAAGVLLIVALAFAAMAYVQRAPVDTEAIRFSVPTPEGWSLALDISTAGGATAPLAISPDGRRLAFIARSREGRDRLWIRALDTLASQELPGTDGVSSPFWSPDSRFLGFFADGKLKKIDVTGGPSANDLVRHAGQ